MFQSIPLLNIQSLYSPSDVLHNRTCLNLFDDLKNSSFDAE